MNKKMEHEEIKENDEKEYKNFRKDVDLFITNNKDGEKIHKELVDGMEIMNVPYSEIKKVLKMFLYIGINAFFSGENLQNTIGEHIKTITNKYKCNDLEIDDVIECMNFKLKEELSIDRNEKENIKKKKINCKPKNKNRFMFILKEIYNEDEDALVEIKLEYIKEKKINGESENRLMFILKEVYNEDEDALVEIQLEHILPRNPHGCSDWCKDFTENDRDCLTNKIGNLTLLEKSINEPLGNSDFCQGKDVSELHNKELFELRDKEISQLSKKEAYGLSKIKANDYLVEQDKWTEVEICTRADEISKKIDDYLKSLAAGWSNL